jgi:SAM-dependent methyltransferase
MTQRDDLGSPDRFGYEWSTYATILPESRVQLERWLGSIPLASFAGKSVLDVGCGMGRNPYWYLREGAARLLAVDVDDKSLGAAQKNLAEFPNAKVEKASAYDLDPALHGQFDRVTCVGVLHHLAEPEAALAAMWRCVAPGGRLILWCYGREGNRALLPAIQVLRFIGSRAPLPLTHALAKGVALVAWPALRFLPWKTDYYRFLRTLSRGNVESIIFDQMLPHIAHYWTEAEMTRLLGALPGGEAVLELVQGNSWHVHVDKRP